MTGGSLQPVRAGSVWSAADLERDQSWEYALSAPQRCELEADLQSVRERGLALHRHTGGNASVIP